MKKKLSFFIWGLLTFASMSYLYADSASLQKARAALQRGNDLSSKMEKEKQALSRLAYHLREIEEQSRRSAEGQKQEIEKIRKQAALAEKQYQSGVEKASALKREYDLFRKEKERKEAFYETLHQTVAELRKGQHQIEPVTPRSEKEQKEFGQLLKSKEMSLETAFQDLSNARKKFLELSANRAQSEQVELPTLKDRAESFADQLRVAEKKLKGVPARQLSGFERHDQEQYEFARRELQRLYEETQNAYREAQRGAKNAFDEANKSIETDKREQDQAFKEKGAAFSQYKISNETWEREAKKKISSKEWSSHHKRLGELRDVTSDALTRLNKATQKLAEIEGKIASLKYQVYESESIQNQAQSHLIALEQNRPK